jgi:NitT/TauT family transport system substrate-binding protein
MRLRLYENYRFVLYAPFYAAHAIGAYAAEGLEVELSPSPGTGKAEQALIDGAVEAIWAGPMRVMKHHDDDPASPLVCFAEIVCRDPFSIVGRYPNPDFRLADLAHLRFATVSEVPTPWLCLQEDLRQAGLDPERLDRIADRTMADNLAALRGGHIDAAQFFEPAVDDALVSGAGHLWYAAATRGLTAYTTLVARRAVIAARHDELLAMVRAMRRTLRWIAATQATDIAQALKDFFPNIPRTLSAAAIARYQALDLYAADPLMPRAGFERLKAAMLSGGALSHDIPFEDCVDTSLAQQAPSPA